jgi:hypothetical protein
MHRRRPSFVVLIIIFGFTLALMKAHAVAGAPPGENRDSAAIETNACFSVLSTTDLSLHIPAFFFPQGGYSLDLAYSPTGPIAEQAIWFRYTGLTVSTATNCTYPPPLFLAADKLMIRIPMILFGPYALWMEMEYVAATDGQL